MAAVALLPCAFTFFAKTGPFAWDGWMALWFVVVAFVGWFLVMFWEVRRAILRQAEASSIGFEGRAPATMMKAANQ